MKYLTETLYFSAKMTEAKAIAFENNKADLLAYLFSKYYDINEYAETVARAIQENKVEMFDALNQPSIRACSKIVGYNEPLDNINICMNLGSSKFTQHAIRSRANEIEEIEDEEERNYQKNEYSRDITSYLSNAILDNNLELLRDIHETMVSMPSDPWITPNDIIYITAAKISVEMLSYVHEHIQPDFNQIRPYTKAIIQEAFGCGTYSNWKSCDMKIVKYIVLAKVGRTTIPLFKALEKAVMFILKKELLGGVGTIQFQRNSLHVTINGAQVKKAIISIEKETDVDIEYNEGSARVD
jgi:hypothetical protein